MTLQCSVAAPPPQIKKSMLVTKQCQCHKGTDLVVKGVFFLSTPEVMVLVAAAGQVPAVPGSLPDKLDGVCSLS